MCCRSQDGAGGGPSTNSRRLRRLDSLQESLLLPRLKENNQTLTKAWGSIIRLCILSCVSLGMAAPQVGTQLGIKTKLAGGGQRWNWTTEALAWTKLDYGSFGWRCWDNSTASLGPGLVPGNSDNMCGPAAPEAGHLLQDS